MADDEQWNPVIAQINAIAALTGVTVGALRMKGVLTQEEINQIFSLTDSIMPDQTGLHGANTLARIKMIVDNIND